MGYQVTSIEVVGAYESERLVLRQKSGEDAVFTRSDL